MADILEEIWPKWMHEGHCFGTTPAPDPTTLSVIVGQQDGKDLLSCGHLVDPLFDVSEAPYGSYRRNCVECGGSDKPVHNIWMPQKGGKVVEEVMRAKSICEGGEDGNTPCPVKEQCLAFALENKLSIGVWGGKSPVDRIKMKQRRARDQEDPEEDTSSEG